MGDRKVAPQPAQLRISGIYFSFYSTEEVERLSVVEVREAASFDTLGHAQPGGLYDPRLGPCEPNDPPCTTCSSNFTNCPGHPGHICLPLPAFHPLLYFTTLKLLRGSCLFCHRVMCSANTLAMRSFLVRLALVDQGRLTDVDRVQELLDGATGAGSTATVQDLEQELNAFIGVGESSVKDEGHQLNRHRVDAREKLVREFCNDQLFKARVKCPHCSSRQPKYRNEFCRTIVLDFTVGNKKEAEKNQRDPRSYAMEMEEEEAKDELDEVEEAGGTVKEQSAEEKAAAEVAMLRWLREQGGAEVGIDAQLRAAAADQTAQLVWTAHEVRQQLRLVWQLDSVLLGAVFPMFKEPRINAALTTKTEGGNEGSREVGMERLFVSSVLVSPSRFRPVRFLAGDKFDHPHTAGFKRLIEESHLVSAILQLLNGVKSPALEDLITNKLPRSTTKENVLRLRTALSQMQDRINLLFDQDLNKLEPKQIPGLRQILEKKEGLFRMNMMGKRVNFCARTVITPDPFLAVDEIGVPSVFSKRLTFPEYVNELNLPNLRRLVVDGPDAIHGANFVHMSSQGRQVRLNPSDAQSRKALASRLHAADPARDLKAPPTVLRHLRNGDVMMMNRQPTLHKPSIMGHKARILTGQKAFRMNYAPCKAYNADFDGDEMNGHFTQDFLARAETAELGAVARNYLVPKDGTPILGLIQDHVISASLLSLRGSRFTKADYNALLLSAFPVISHRLRILPPAYIKPGPFWTGKQIISSVIINVLPKDQPALNLDGKAKTSEKNWETPDGTMPLISELTESKVVIRAGELVQGIFDKAHFGATQFGLIHCVLELYGPQVGANLLSAFSRLFTTYLRIHGFSLGVRDILVQPGPDHRRTKIIRRLRECGIQVVMNAFNLEEVEESGERWDEDKLRDLLQLKYTTESEDVKQLDFNMKQATDKFNGKINSAIIPQGLVAPFPLNGLQLMIQAGAKGTMVNAIQISCMIGQIELEGQRPPLSASGRTLPSFKPYDVSPRAGGFVDGRFLTGIPPQELFFHTMAGREGLIDTAVKTSRSGYLQRCIIKHLEGLSVRYDHSVRDADGSLIQFDYGEDGLDVGKSRFLNTSLLRFLADNAKVALASTVPLASDPKGKPRRQPSLRQIKPSEVALTVLSEIQKGEKERKVGQRESAFLGMCAKEGLNGSVGVGTNGGRSEGYKEAVAAWRKLEPKKRAKLERRHGRRPPDPLTAFLHRTSHLAALPDATLDVVSDDNIKKAVPKASPKDIARLRQAFYWKALRAFAEPGENVGLLASQSIGEPSTQMTLNTFHFAGRGEMNVTLGIPRLREILMVASKTIKTPTSETPFKEGVTEAAKLGLKQALDRVLLKDVLKSFCVTEAARLNSEEEFWYITLLVEIKSPKKRSPEAPTIPSDQVLLALEKGLYKRLGSALLKRQEEAANLADLAHKAMKTYADEVSDAVQASRAGPADGNDGDDSDADVVGGGEDGDGISGARLRARQNDAGEYEGEEEEAVAFAAPDSDQENAGDEEGASVAMSETEDNGPGASSTPAPPKVLKEMNPTRINAVTRTNRLISDYSYDARRSKWAKCTFKMPLNKGRLDVKAIFERELKHFIVRTVPGIEKCFLPKDENVMRTAGVNLQELFKYGDVLDLNRVHTNDVHLVASTYGIEAAARVLVAEVKKVFGGYGIVVDNRHLSLVGDYLLYSGAYRAFNRSAMASTASTLQKMTYESTTKFLREAILHGYSDSAQSPSARLVVGETVGGGTGAFDLRLPLRSLFNAQPKSVSAQKANTLAK